MAPSVQLGCSRRRAVAFFAIISLAVIGCTPGEVRFDGYISAASSSALQLSWVEAKRTNEGIEIWGQLQQVRCCRPMRGHIHFEAEGPSGIKLASTNAKWGEFNPRQLHSAWFKAVLPVPKDKTVSTIQIVFETDA